MVEVTPYVAHAAGIVETATSRVVICAYHFAYGNLASVVPCGNLGGCRRFLVKVQFGHVQALSTIGMHD